MSKFLHLILAALFVAALAAGCKKESEPAAADTQATTGSEMGAPAGDDMGMEPAPATAGDAGTMDDMGGDDMGGDDMGM